MTPQQFIQRLPIPFVIGATGLVSTFLTNLAGITPPTLEGYSTSWFVGGLAFIAGACVWIHNELKQYYPVLQGYLGQNSAAAASSAGAATQTPQNGQSPAGAQSSATKGNGASPAGQNGTQNGQNAQNGASAVPAGGDSGPTGFALKASETKVTIGDTVTFGVANPTSNTWQLFQAGVPGPLTGIQSGTTLNYTVGANSPIGMILLSEGSITLYAQDSAGNATNQVVLTLSN